MIHFCLLHLKVYLLCLKKLETALNEFLWWADLNYWIVIYSKTNYIVFSRIISIEKDLKIRVCNNTIERVKTYRYLYFIVDENVSRQEHAKLLGNKLSRSLGVIRHLKFRFPKKILKMIWFVYSVNKRKKIVYF